MSQPLDYIGLLIAFCTIRILPSSNCPFPWGYRVSSPPNTWFLQSLGFIRLHTPNGISIGFTRFCRARGCDQQTNTQTDRDTHRPRYIYYMLRRSVHVLWPPAARSTDRHTGMSLWPPSLPAPSVTKLSYDHLPTKFSQPPNLHICITSSQCSFLAALALRHWSHSLVVPYHLLYE